MKTTNKTNVIMVVLGILVLAAAMYFAYSSGRADGDKETQRSTNQNAK